MDPYYDPMTGLPFDPLTGAPASGRLPQSRPSPTANIGAGGDMHIDPLTGRPMVRGPGGYARGEDFTAPPGLTTADRMRNMAARQAEQRAAEQSQAPATQRPGGGYGSGIGDGAPMFDDNPTAPPAPAPQQGALASAMPPEPPQEPPQEPQPADSGIAPPLPVPPGFQPPPAAPQAPATAPQQAATARPAQPAPDGALTAPTAQPQQTPPTDNDYEAFAQRLGAGESGGRWDAMNGGGYAGRVQFGAPRLQTLGVYSPGQGENMRGWGAGGGNSRASGAWTGSFNIPGFPEVRTIEDFRNNHQAQRAVERAHFTDIDQAIDSTPGAEVFNRDGLRAVANLGGNGGMRAFVQSGGQANPADGNGTRLSDFYRRFAGSDAPAGSPGMSGGGVASAPGSFQSTAGRAAPSPYGTPNMEGGPSADFLSGSPGAMVQPTFMGIPSSALMAAGSGMLAGRTPMEGMARAGEAFNGQMNREQALGIQRENNESARADRRLARQDTRDYRDAQTRIAEQRIAAARGRTGASGENVQSSTIVQGPDGNAYRSTILRNGQTSITTLSGGEVSEEIASQLRQGNNPSAGPEARDMIAQRNTAFQEAAAARTLRPALANARRVLEEDPNLTGSDWGTRGVNWIAETLGIPVGGRTPENIAMLRQALQQGNMQTLMQIAPSLRPMSNVDLQAIAQMSPSMLSNPRMIGQWLDQMDRGAERAERMGDALAAQLADPAVAQSIMRTGGVAAWRQRYEAERTRNERGGDQPRPTIQPGTNDQGQREWQPAPQNPQQRRVGETYQTQRGPMIWRGQGWEPAQ